MGLAQTILTTFIGWAVCVCTAAVALAVGLDVEHDEFVPLPFFFTDVPIYAEQGSERVPSVRSNPRDRTTGVPTGVCRNVLVYFDPIATAGIPRSFVQTGSLLLTILTVTAVTESPSELLSSDFKHIRFNNETMTATNPIQLLQTTTEAILEQTIR